MLVQKLRYVCGMKNDYIKSIFFLCERDSGEVVFQGHIYSGTPLFQPTEMRIPLYSMELLYSYPLK